MKMRSRLMLVRGLPDSARKRLFDIVVASAMLVLAAPIMLVCALAIKLYDRGPILYRGERVGLYGRRFRLLKFRTMVPDAPRLGGTSTPDDDPRLLPFGRLMRRLKLDELPNLFNVVKGEMSFVGPRPQVAWAVKLYTKEQRELLSVRPGITDYASLRFRNEGEILRGCADPDREYLEKIAPEKIELGLEYVRTRSVFVDLRIIVATIWATMGGDPWRIVGSRARPAETLVTAVTGAPRS
jgi:lipopolysaccharide/colanic/teichoic acid biosynthesis glycosyltransferase